MDILDHDATLYEHGTSLPTYLSEDRARQLAWSLDGATATLAETIRPTALRPEEFVTPSSTATTTPTQRPIHPHLPVDQIICGDALGQICRLPNECIQLVITSPPYFQQRTYGETGLGNEESLEEYLAVLVRLFGECMRVLSPDGSIVFNLGDKYADSSLLLVPYRFALAVCTAYPVRLINTITWVKQNPTPRQFKRRLVSSTEPFFHFAKGDDYFYNPQEFLREGGELAKKGQATSRNLGKSYFTLIAQSNLTDAQKQRARADLTGVIEEAQQGSIAGFRMKIKGIHAEAFGGQEGGRKIQMDKNGYTIIRLRGEKMKRDVIETPVETLKGCPHPAIYPTQIVTELLQLLTREGDVVLDPFMGSGSTALACRETNRRYIGYDINPQYCTYAQERVRRI